MNCSRLLCVALLALGVAAEHAAAERDRSAPAASAQSIERFQGVAQGDDGKVAYRERHEVRYAGGVPQQSVTWYFDATGKKLAELRSDYRGNRYAPRYLFSAADGRRLEAAAWVEGGVRFEHGQETKLVRRSADREVRTVFGQGLHQLVRATLSDLALGRKLRVNFGIPSRFDFYGFRIERAGPPRGDVVRLEVEIDDWFLRIFAPKLEVDYDTRTRRLLWYRGVSNVPGPKGEVQHVTIRYQYPSEPRLESTPGALATATAAAELKP